MQEGSYHNLRFVDQPFPFYLLLAHGWNSTRKGLIQGERHAKKKILILLWKKKKKSSQWNKKIPINFQNSGCAFKTINSGCAKDSYFTIILNLSLCYCACSDCLGLVLAGCNKSQSSNNRWAKMHQSVNKALKNWFSKCEAVSVIIQKKSLHLKCHCSI